MSDSGVIFENDFNVKFDELKQDLAKRGQSRLLWQFQNSPVITQIVEQLSKQLQDVYDAAIGVLEGRTLSKAEGINLEKLGYLVGQGRDFGKITESDNNYRRYILGKILKNHSKGGTILENRYSARYMTGIPMSFIKVALQSYRFVFSVQTFTDEEGQPANPPEEIGLLARMWSNLQVNSFYMLPVPSTVWIDTRVAMVFPQQEGDTWLGFGPDKEEMRPDYALVAVGVNISQNNIEEE